MTLLSRLIAVDEPQDGQEARFPSDYRTGHKKLRNQLAWLFIPEYGLAPAFFALGYHERFNTAAALQGSFMLLSGIAQWRIYSDHKCFGSMIWGPDHRYVELQGDVKTIAGVPVSCLKIPRVLFLFLSQLPNYVHVHQTAVVAGASFLTWNPLLQNEFERRWRYVPILGGFIGSLGMPELLTMALGLSCISHGIAAGFAFCTNSWSEQADAANLLFLSFFLPGNSGPIKKETGAGLSRLAMGLFSKVPMLYLKTSLTMLTWDCIAAPARRANILGIILAWYALVPVIHISGKVLRDSLRQGACDFRLAFTFSVAFGFFLLGLLLIHLCGIFFCASHDLALSHLGCTPPSGEDFCNFTSLNATVM